MARQLGDIVQNHFGQGYITEATGLNFPPNAAVIANNCIFTQKQSVTPRYGFNYESGSTNTAAVTTGNIIREYYWEGAAGLGNINFVVVQNGATISFYNVGTATSLSAGIQATTIDLDSYEVSGAPTTATQACAFASGNGYLFIAHPYVDPLYIVYDPIALTLTPTQVILQQRDVIGTQADTSYYPWNTRPTTLTSPHYYNLANQGWLYTNNTTGGTVVPTATYVTQFHAAIVGTDETLSVYPSNADIWWSFKNSSGVFQPGNTATPVAVGLVLGINVGNTPAPKGHFILDCFNQDRAGVYAAETTLLYDPQTITGVAVVSASYFRPSAVAFFAGRAWFAGVNYGIFTNSIYYSQIIQQQFQIGFCYQSNDPTSDDTGVADLVSSDGGVLIEPEIGQIYQMYPVAYSLLIFASNGIWAITGSTGTGFTATDFSVAKISSIGMVSPTSFVDVDGIPMWWNYDGVYTLSGTGGSTSPAGGAGTAVISVSDETIKTFFVSLPTASKLNAKGSYNRRLNTIYWIYNLSTPNTTPNIYDSVLCLNTVTKAFYPWSLPTNGITISGITTVQGQGQLLNSLNVSSTVNLSAVTKFLTQVAVSGTNYLTWSEVADPSIIDYNGTLNLPYQANAVSGYSLDANGTKFQAPYIIFVLNNTLASQIQISAFWNSATNLYTNKESSLALLQTEGGNWSYVDFRRKIRGEGRSLNIAFVGIPGQWFEVAGWYVETSSNTQQ